MLTAEMNERLTRVGPDTPAGGLLRRYWYPIAVAQELEREPVRRVRLLGENLALFRDRSGRLGLVAERCPHRGASLAYGFPTEQGLRCPYHGWMFSTEGDCLEQPNQAQDSPRFREQCGIVSYHAEELGGLVFGYVGPEPAPPIPPFDMFTQEESATTFRDVGYAMVPCNWLQIVENNMDPLHVEWLHGQLFNYHLELAGEEPTEVFGGHHAKIGFDLFEHGIIKRRMRVGQTEDDDDWKVGHPVMFPTSLKVGGIGVSQFQIRVPVDDTNTLYFWYSLYEVRDDVRDALAGVRALPDHYPVTLQRPDGSFLMHHIDAQDAMVWVTQGAIADRTKENLCQSDRGVLLFRQLLEDQLAVHEAGGRPMNVYAPGAAPARIDLPLEHKVIGFGGGRDNPLEQFLRTQGMYSPRLNEAVRAIDAMLGLPARPRAEAFA